MDSELHDMGDIWIWAGVPAAILGLWKDNFWGVLIFIAVSCTVTAWHRIFDNKD